MGLDVWGVSPAQIRIYYILVATALVYFLSKYRKQYFTLFIVLLFFSGLFGYLGKNILNYYRIALTVGVIYWMFKTRIFHSKKKGSNIVITAFILFTAAFFLTAFLNRDYMRITFSQYSRYLIIFGLYMIFNKYRSYSPLKLLLDKLIYELLILQIILSFAKYLIIGPAESIVGSIASRGGATATYLPMLGFIFIWLRNKGRLGHEGWLVTFGLMFIGFVSYKRAIWFIMPVVIAILNLYIPKRQLPARALILSMVAIPLVFYLGIRFNPTLNEEGRIGGSYDFEYALNYAAKYTFGDKTTWEYGTGRGGTTMFFINQFITGNYPMENWFGYGLRFMYATTYAEFAELDFSIDHKGSATGVFQTMVANGYLGVFTLLGFVLSILLQTKNVRFKIFLVGIFFWEYFFYTGILIREPSLSFFMVYFVIFSEKHIVRNKVLRLYNQNAH